MMDIRIWFMIFISLPAVGHASRSSMTDRLYNTTALISKYDERNSTGNLFERIKSVTALNKCKIYEPSHDPEALQLYVQNMGMHRVETDLTLCRRYAKISHVIIKEQLLSNYAKILPIALKLMAIKPVPPKIRLAKRLVRKITLDSEKLLRSKYGQYVAITGIKFPMPTELEYEEVFKESSKKVGRDADIKKRVEMLSDEIRQILKIKKADVRYLASPPSLASDLKAANCTTTIFNTINLGITTYQGELGVRKDCAFLSREMNCDVWQACRGDFDSTSESIRYFTSESIRLIQNIYKHLLMIIRDDQRMSIDVVLRNNELRKLFRNRKDEIEREMFR